MISFADRPMNRPSNRYALRSTSEDIIPFDSCYITCNDNINITIKLASLLDLGKQHCQYISA